MFEGNDISVFGTMVTVLGTSSKQRSIEVFFMNQLGVIGLEMEGSYYQKAIQSASKIKKCSHDVRDMPIMPQITLRNRKHISFRRTGNNGVKPTYLITIKILEQILT
jgi:hypothetical protein